jgi:SAM-dependent methyltransferase
MSAPTETFPRGRAAGVSPDVPERRVFLPEGPAQNGKESAYFLVEELENARQVRFRGDPRIWEWAGVYEHLVKRLLRGNAPAALARLLRRALDRTGMPADQLRCVLLGAGNAWAASELRDTGVGSVVCVDAWTAAAAAAERDYRDAYDAYLVLDMRRLSESQRDQLMEFDFNCLVSVDPLGADEPAPNAFTEAFNLLAPGGWIALHLSEEAASGEIDSRFARVVLHMIAGGAFEVETRERYRHRLSTGGDPIYHHALVGRKIRDFDPGEPQ